MPAAPGVGLLVVGVLAAMTGHGTGSGEFTVALPHDWRAARSVTLVVHDVSVAKHRPVVFRIRTADGAGDETTLGSFAVVAQSPTAKGAWRFAEFRVPVGRTLARWADRNPGARSLRVRIDPVDSHGRVQQDLEWSARDVVLDAR